MIRTFQSFYEEAMRETTYDLVSQPGFTESKIKKESEIPSFPEYCEYLAEHIKQLDKIK